MACEARAAMTRFDTIVIGAGISGASLAFALASDRRVLLLEAEAAPGYHSTGRSAALYTRNYGPPVVQRINAASHAFFVEPPPGFTDVKLLRPRGAITVAAARDATRFTRGAPVTCTSANGGAMVSRATMPTR